MDNTVQLFNIMVKDGDPVAVSLEETLAYFNDGWAIVKAAQAEDSTQAISVYTASFCENHRDDHLFSTISWAIKSQYNAKEQVNSDTKPSKKSNKVCTAAGAVAGAAAAESLFDDDSLNNSMLDDLTSPFDDDSLNSSMLDDSTSPFDDSMMDINPATALPMIGGMGGVDVAGNTFGSSDSFSSTSSFD